MTATKTTRKTKVKAKIEVKEGRCLMTNKGGFTVEVLNNPEQIKVLKQHGWTEG